MPKELPEHHLPPLSTRMIFLHHRVRMHDSSTPGYRRISKRTPRTAFIAWGLLLAVLVAAAILSGGPHA